MFRLNLHVGYYYGRIVTVRMRIFRSGPRAHSLLLDWPTAGIRILAYRVLSGKVNHSIRPAEEEELWLIGAGKSRLAQERSFNMASIADRVYKMARPLVEARGLNLVDVEYQKEGENWFLRIFIENPEEDLLLKDCEVINKILGTELDRENFIDRSYILEVSSPGIERPLKTEQDFKDHTGELVFIKTYAPFQGQKEFEGTLKGFKDKDEDDEEVRVQLKIKEGVISIPFSKIANAHLLLDF